MLSPLHKNPPVEKGDPRGMRLTLVLAFLFCWVFPAFAQSGPVLNPVTPVEISNEWKVHKGDDPNWSAPDFNDSAWATTDIARAWASRDFDGFSWFRRDLRLANPGGPASFESIGVQFGQLYYGDYQVFANGREIGHSGAFPPASGSSSVRPAAFSIPANVIGPDGRLRVAVRVWKNPNRSKVSAYLADRLVEPQKGFAVGVFDVLRDRIAVAHQGALKGDVDRLVVMFLFFLACHYYIEMFLARREVPEYLWFGLCFFCFALNTFTNSVWADEFLSPLAANVIRVSSRQFAEFFIVQFIFLFLKRSISRWLKVTQLLCLLWGCLVLVWPEFSISVIDKWVFLMILPLIFYSLWVMAEEAWRGNVEARPFLAGFGILFGIEILTVARTFGVIHIPQIAHWGVAGLMVSMAFSIAIRFNRVYDGLDAANHELELKVAERTAELYEANSELAESVSKLEAAHAETNRKKAALDQKIAELDGKNQELTMAQQQADRIFSALALALPGTVLDEKYRLDEKIGEGGFGVVFRATHLTLGRAIAVKVFKPRAGNDNAEAIERFKREGISIARLSHPNIISVLDSGISATGIVYLVMELLTGQSLADDLRAATMTTIQECVERMIPVCRALAEAHQIGIIHRDIKPDNIFLNRTPGGEVVKVVDFGIAKMMLDEKNEDLERLTATDNLIGTPVYMAPERLGGKAYDGRSDVYSVGVVLYELLAGRPPFEKSLSGLVGIMLAHLKDPPPPLRDLNPFVPSSIEDIINRTLEKIPERRPTAPELADRLAAALAALPADVRTMPFDRLAPREAFISTQHSSFPSL